MYTSINIYSVYLHLRVQSVYTVYVIPYTDMVCALEGDNISLYVYRYCIIIYTV
jgi:hypothetical protein